MARVAEGRGVGDRDYHYGLTRIGFLALQRSVCMETFVDLDVAGAGITSLACIQQNWIRVMRSRKEPGVETSRDGAC